MHSELLMQLKRGDEHISDRSSNPHFEIAAWLKLKNAEGLPAMLLLEYTDRSGTRWQIIDRTTIRAAKATVLLSGVLDLEVQQLKAINLYLCHPNPSLGCEIEELRFNEQLVKSYYLRACLAA